MTSISKLISSMPRSSVMVFFNFMFLEEEGDNVVPASQPAPSVIGESLELCFISKLSWVYWLSLSPMIRKERLMVERRKMVEIT